MPAYVYSCCFILINNFISDMDQTTRTQRSKSFKALSMAQPIRKDIEQTLNKLEMEKRKYLANDREETLLKE